MESWPQDLRAHIPENKKIAGKVQSDTRKPIEARNALDVGSRGSAGFQSGQVKWSFAGNVSESGRQWSDSSEIVKVFPETAFPALPVKPSTLLTKTTEMARFLRNQYTDVAIPFDVLQEEITSDIRALASQPVDFLRGNRLSACLKSGGESAYGYVAFPMGRNASELCLSAVRRVQGEGLSLPNWTIDVSSRPSASFMTPIEHVIFSSALHKETESSLLGVRCSTGRDVGTSFFLVPNKPPRQDSVFAPLIPAMLVDQFGTLDTDGRRHADVAVTMSPEPTALIVNDMGKVYKWTEDTLTSLPSPAKSTEPGWWRVAFRSSNEQVMLANDRTVYSLDFRDSSSVPIYYLDSHNGPISSMEVSQDPEVICLTTTDHVVWLDARRTDRALLSWKHRRGWVKSLQTTTCVDEGVHRTLLWSRSDRLISVYDLDFSVGPVQSVSSPYTLTAAGAGSSLAGLATLRDVHDSGSTLLFELSTRNGVTVRNMNRAGGGRTSITVPWNESITALEVPATEWDDPGPHGIRESQITDLRQAYKEIVFASQSRKAPKNSLQRVAALMDRLSTITSEHDAPLEHILTTLDLALLAEEKSREQKKTHFFHFRTLQENRAPLQWTLSRLYELDLGRSSAWHASLAPALEKISPDPLMTALCAGPTVVSELASMFSLRGAPVPRQQVDEDMDDVEAADHQAMVLSNKEHASFSELAMDLALTHDICSSEPFRRPRSHTDLESATRALSISSLEPPPISFSYLHPRKDEEDGDSDGEQMPQSSSVDATQGIRLLLSDWSLGSDPYSYEHIDPYGAVGGFNVPQPKRTFKRRSPKPELKAFRASPPPIIKVEPNTLMTVLQPTMGREAWRSNTQIAPSQSTDPMGASQQYPNTQQAPGAFGDRPEARIAKKKVAKKRLAGF